MIRRPDFILQIEILYVDFQPMWLQFWPAGPNSSGFGASKHGPRATPIAVIKVSLNEKMTSPAETSRIKS